MEIREQCFHALWVGVQVMGRGAGYQCGCVTSEWLEGWRQRWGIKGCDSQDRWYAGHTISLFTDSLGVGGGVCDFVSRFLLIGSSTSYREPALKNGEI